MELGDTYVKNAQLQGQTNFLNQYGHGNTQVDNLSGLRGSVQNFGLQELLIGPEWTWNPNVAKPAQLWPSHSYQITFLTSQKSNRK